MERNSILVIPDPSNWYDRTENEEQKYRRLPVVVVVVVVVVFVVLGALFVCLFVCLFLWCGGNKWEID